MSTSRPTVKQATAKWLRGLTDPPGPLSALALTLASEVDEGKGWQTAKELRAVLKELTPDDGGDPFADLMRQLADAPVRNATD